MRSHSSGMLELQCLGLPVLHVSLQLTTGHMLLRCGDALQGDAGITAHVLAVRNLFFTLNSPARAIPCCVCVLRNGQERSKLKILVHLWPKYASKAKVSAKITTAEVSVSRLSDGGL